MEFTEKLKGKIIEREVEKVIKPEISALSIDLNRQKEQARLEKEKRLQNMRENLIIVSEPKLHVFEDY